MNLHGAPVADGVVGPRRAALVLQKGRSAAVDGQATCLWKLRFGWAAVVLQGAKARIEGTTP